jgi:hypothetical protein
LDVSREFFIRDAIRLRLELLALGENPKTAGLRLLNRLMQAWAPKTVDRMLWHKSLEETILGSESIQDFEDMAQKRGIRPLELLALALRFRLKDAGIESKADWIMPYAQEVIECMSQPAVEGGAK